MKIINLNSIVSRITAKFRFYRYKRQALKDIDGLQQYFTKARFSTREPFMSIASKLSKWQFDAYTTFYSTVKSCIFDEPSDDVLPSAHTCKNYVETSLGLFILKAIDELGLSRGLFETRQKSNTFNDSFYDVASNNIRYIANRTKPTIPVFFLDLIKAAFDTSQPYEKEELYLHIILEVIEPLLTECQKTLEEQPKGKITTHDVNFMHRDFGFSISEDTAKNDKQKYKTETKYYQIKDENGKRLNVNSTALKIEASDLVSGKEIASDKAIRYAESILREIDKQKYFEWELIRVKTIHSGVVAAKSENDAKKRLRELFCLRRLPNGYKLRQISKEVYKSHI